ncbi:hypothetical protein K438DRAFT_1815947 [Mycena galopus ATCC 62051]|nr:hypothetical protein K438DRAFT_1815947 [Mycena galopus ATCC 62051]
MRRLSKPLLPPDLVEKIKADDMMSGFESSVFMKHFHKDRLMMRNWKAPISPDSFVEDPAIGFTAAMKRTALHSASFDGDVLAVYECLRLGASADKADSSGITPICLAISQLAKATSPHVLVLRSDGSRTSAADVGREISRLKFVIRILVEQHVALNTSIDGEPLVNLLCRSRAWDTIALFFEHGAIPPTNPGALFRTADDRSRFAALVKARRPNISRPPRKCPCWSGKSISECHGNSQPYPPQYVCVCGSGKTYEICCFLRKDFVSEKWDPTSQRILHDYDNSAVQLFQKLTGPGKEIIQAVADACGVEYDHATPPMTPEIWRAQVKNLLGDDLGRIDPAFAYALYGAQFLPRPRARSRSRPLCNNEQKQWNALVDEYIATQGDKRSRHSIERAAKIGTWQGALIRTCEGPGCTEVEGLNHPTFSYCGKCKMSVYCGPVCQRADWKNHKKQCGKEGQFEQSLPSADILLQRARLAETKALEQYNTLLEMGKAMFG